MLHARIPRILAAALVLALLGCSQAYPAKRELATYKASPTWATSVAIITVDTGNELFEQPTSSQVSDRRSRADLESMAARLEIRTRAPMDIAADSLGDVLTGLGLRVLDLDAAPDDPGEFNVIIERAEYIVGVRAEPPAQLAFEVHPAYHVRVLEPSVTQTFEGTPVPILLEQPMDMDDAQIAVHAANIEESRREAILGLRAWLAAELASHHPPKKP